MKGVQTVLVSDVHRVRPFAYKYRYMLHMKTTRWNVWGDIKVKEIMEVLKMVVEG